jgi:hypothetical protein
MIEIAIPTTEILEETWSIIEPFVQRAINESHGELSMDVIKDKMRRKELLIATIFDDANLIAVCSFEIINFESGKRVLSIHTAGGEGHELWYKDIDKMANELAKVHDCSQVYIIGRKGWQITEMYLAHHNIDNNQA